MNANKDFLGGIFKWPDLKDLKKKVREKFGYLPRENPSEYYPEPLIDPPCIPPRYPFPCIRTY
jgi:hypothetical protein